MKKPFLIKIVNNETAGEIETDAQNEIDFAVQEGYEPIKIQFIPSTDNDYGRLAILFKLVVPDSTSKGEHK